MVVSEPRDGNDGWQLIEYSWDEKTGIGSYTYQRYFPDLKTVLETVVQKAQPYHPSHVGWYTGALR